MTVIVKKFGGTSVSSIAKLKKIADNLANEISPKKKYPYSFICDG